MLYIPFSLKCCIQCGEYKPATKIEFLADKRRKGGLTSWCRSCENETARLRRAKNPEKYREADRLRHENNPEIRSEARKRSYYKHRDKNRKKKSAYGQRYNEAHKDERRKYNDVHKDEISAAAHKRRAEKRQLPATFTPQHWSIAVNYFHDACAYCEHGPSFLDIHKVLQKDHFIPSYKGGGYTPDNIVPACQSCNVSKGTSDPTKWLIRRFSPRKAKAILKRVQDYFEWIRSHQ